MKPARHFLFILLALSLAGRLFASRPGSHVWFYTFGQISSADMELTVAKDRIGHFESKPLPDNPGEDPFSRDNNGWRIPATHKETDAEIKKRLYNHCRFWEFYFKWSQDKKLDIVDVRSTPTPIKMYGNGFGLRPLEDLPPRWKSYFFDDDDCWKANDILKDIFEHQTIAWSNSASKYKMFLGAFQQLEGFLR
ncbi:MAG TPA: hypothetical protein VGS79_23420 [Puia sp.]|nr:hypothetical protein [Puia sp.]